MTRRRRGPAAAEGTTLGAERRAGTNHVDGVPEPRGDDLPVRVLIRGAVAEIVLSRPERRNALDVTAGVALAEAVEEVRGRDDVRAVIVRGEGAAFCAGGDVKAMSAGAHEGRGEPVLRQIAGVVHTAIVGLTRLPKPVIASVHGQAYGAGFSLALACDMVVASHDATFCQAFIKLAATPDSGSTYFLPRVVGRQVASELIMLGDPVSAERAYQLGMVNRVVPRRELDGQVRDLAERLARGPAQAYARAKQLIAASAHAGLEQQLENERISLGECARTEDFLEGVDAFVNKRVAVFGATR
ncbi:enoyl-CoA hydratase-related protein [Micromonospora sp. NPDC050495]|uniref:enoyl-CoA hydratase/isomerase family protein n=1 Tax=Micromonospora sp. NPDC050495 TaxID=3154936 RepID=UPI00340D6FAB